MFFEFDGYKIDVDVEKTRQFYENDEEISCTCDGCQNYLKSVENLPDEILSVQLN